MSQEKETGLVIRPPTEVAGFDEVRAQVHRLDEFYRNLMTPETDYGVIPGTKKPTLYLAGAQLLRIWGGLIPEFKVNDTGTDLAIGLYNYTIVCDLYIRRLVNNVEEKVYVGQGIGSCSSLESKYRWRWLYENQLPSNVDKGSLPQKKISGKGGGSFTVYRMDNDNPFDLGNTILKMAKKRSFVDGILTVTGASRIFTQDLEDMEILGQEEPQQKGKPTVKPPRAKTPEQIVYDERLEAIVEEEVAMLAEDRKSGKLRAKSPVVSKEMTALMEEIKVEAKRLGLNPREEWDRHYAQLAPDVENVRAWLSELKAKPAGAGDQSPPQEMVADWLAEREMEAQHNRIM